MQLKNKATGKDGNQGGDSVADNSILKNLDIEEWPWEELALEELNDEPENRADAIVRFRALVQEFQKGKKNFNPQTDDDFLMMFLRSRKFDLDKALVCFERFHQIRLCKPELITPVGKGPRDYPHVFDRPLVSMLKRRNPIDGCLVVFWSFRNYNTNEGDISDMLNVSLFGVLEALLHPSIQTHGVRYVFDLTGMGMAHVAMMMTRFYYLKAIMKAQNGVPARFKGMHYINDPYSLTQYVYRIIRPVLSKKMRQRFHFHGRNLEELFTYVSPEILPDEIGGSGGPFNADWYRDALYRDHDKIVENSHFGFVPDEN